MSTTEPKDSDAPTSLLDQAEIRTEPSLTTGADWELRLSVATAAAGLGVWDWDVVANTFVYSQRAREIYGFPLEGDVTPDMIFGATHPDDSYKTRANTTRALDPDIRDTPAYEFRIIRADGSVRWISGYGRALFEERGGEIRAVRYMGTIQDITERKQRDEALCASEERFRTLASFAPVGIFQTGPSGDCTFVNERWCELTGLRPEQAMGTGWVTALHPDDRDRVAREWNNVAEGAEFSSSYRFQAPNGDVRWVQGSSRPIRDPHGRIVGHMGAVMDISALQDAQHAQKILIDELNHRVKNTLATVQALAHLTSRGVKDTQAMASVFNGRVRALSRAHDVLTKELWSGAFLADLVRDTLAPFGETQFDIAGPAIRLPPSAAVSMSLALHELGVNALKFGALSTPAGRVRIRWSTRPQAAADELVFSWVELGGPALSNVNAPAVGVRLIRAALAELRGATTDLAFEPDGVRFTATAAVPRG